MSTDLNPATLAELRRSREVLAAALRKGKNTASSHADELIDTYHAALLDAWEERQRTTPVTARWDRLADRSDDDTTWVYCVAETGQPVALVLDEEHAEALAGSLLGNEDDDQEEDAGLRTQIAATVRTR
ncbi:hypothetical protein [Nocardiopsis lucentensis]|uniref:hypothetical protein n=1 Tax=Nocardiopsis lucentensis TaxID=53441 RepID=UPI0003456C70|nr:hypothetical protein [Nocardiopsis lucentensis]